MLRSRSACPLSVLLATVALSTAGLSTHVHEAAAGHHEETAKAGAEAKGQAKAAKDDLAKLRHLQESVDGMSVLAGSAMLLAGGTDLLPNMKRRQQTPSTLVALLVAMLVSMAVTMRVPEQRHTVQPTEPMTTPLLRLALML